MPRVNSIDDLVFAASHRCSCRAGLAYPINVAAAELAWQCSRVLLGDGDDEQHVLPRPFRFEAFHYSTELDDGKPTTRPGGLTEQARMYLRLRVQGMLVQRNIERLLRADGTIVELVTSRENHQALAALYGSPAASWDATGVVVRFDASCGPTDYLVVMNANEKEAIAG